MIEVGLDLDNKGFCGMYRTEVLIKLDWSDLDL